jgi:hypothetical protein
MKRRILEWLGHMIRINETRVAKRFFLNYARRQKKGGKARIEVARRCRE